MVQVNLDKDQIDLPTDQVVRAVLGVHPRLGAPGLMLECTLCDNPLSTAKDANGKMYCRSCGYFISKEECVDLLDRFEEVLKALRAKMFGTEVVIPKKRKKRIWDWIMFWRRSK